MSKSNIFGKPHTHTLEEFVYPERGVGKILQMTTTIDVNGYADTLFKCYYIVYKTHTWFLRAESKNYLEVLKVYDNITI